MGATVVLLALIGATAFVILQRDTSDTGPGESVQTAAAVREPDPCSTVPGNPAPPPDAGQGPATAAPGSASTQAPGPAAATATPTGRWSSAAPDLGQDCSRSGGAPVTIEIVNRLTVPLEMTWVDDACALHPYGTLAAGSAMTQDTYTGHRWEAGDGAGLSYAGFIPDGSSTRWVIQ